MESSVKHSIPLDILDDLGSRFIINVPEEERKEVSRVFFQIELAHWFYLDFYCTQENKRLRPCGMKEFAAHIFQHIPYLAPEAHKLEEHLEEWREYKQKVPTFGAMLLNEDLSHVLLVQGFWARASWGFPKGKMNEDEDPCRCAVREVFEETGCDVGKLIRPDLFIEVTINYQLARLYIVPGVAMETQFQPQTRGEIKSVQWFAVADLPTTKKDVSSRSRLGVGPNAFFMVLPFIKRLKSWIRDQPKLGVAKPRSQSLSESHTSEPRANPLVRSAQRKAPEPISFTPSGQRKAPEPIGFTPFGQPKLPEPIKHTGSGPRKPSSEPITALGSGQRKPLEPMALSLSGQRRALEGGGARKGGKEGLSAGHKKPSSATKEVKDASGQARRQLFADRKPAPDWLNFRFDRAPLQAFFQ